MEIKVYFFYSKFLLEKKSWRRKKKRIIIKNGNVETRKWRKIKKNWKIYYEGMKLLNYNKNNIENQFVYLFLFFLKINNFFF